jgi:3-deoxy-D-manno-octulosonate 8-phosphate phosphatase (KDO 8-P phosphatase)
MMDETAARIKLLLLDVDGVLTDGSITISSRGEEIKSFDVKDGLGLKRLMSEGVEVVLVSGRKSSSVEWRAGELGIEGVHLGVPDKGVLSKDLIRVRGLRREEVCSMGDDLPDLPMFMESGLRIAVADAVREIREAADYVTVSRGGHGAVREACEWLLRARGKWPSWK